ncbi:hypothetical protein OAE14_00180 [Alphaproteobacteria bacterium]|nr:hypothetical protein [Alphaproteobacteria bacterium]
MIDTNKNKQVATEWEYEHRKISVAVTRKKKTAIDAISNVVEGEFG